MNRYSQKVEVSEDDTPALPFPQDAEFVPGRKKIKDRSVQRPPRPEGEEEKETF